MSIDDQDRREILRRRALLLGSALGSLGLVGCASEPPQEPKTPDTVSVGEAPPEAEQPSEAVEPTLPPRAEPARVSYQLPSQEIPDWVNDEAKQRFESLFKTVTEVHQLLDKAENALPKACSDASDCEAKLAACAEGLHEVGESLRFTPGPCRGSSKSAQAYQERAAEHLEVIEKRKLAVRERALALASEAGDAKAWERAERTVQSSRPTVCLSFACRDW